MKKFLGALIASTTLFTLTTYAAIDPASLIKVTSENNPKCVEYYQYQGELYCSTKPLDTQPVDPHIKDQEKLKIVFDGRPWEAAWGKATPEFTTIEYIPTGDNINQWRELITSQFIPASQKKLTPIEYANYVVENLNKSGFKPVVTFLKKTPEQVIFEFRITEPENQRQDELQMAIKDINGLYILHYVTKEPDMGQKNRDKWVKNFQESKVKNQ